MEVTLETTAHLLWSVFFGSIGVGFFIYGRRQKAGVPFITGVGLFIIPYYVTNSYWLVAAGAALMALPYYFRY